MRIVTYNVRYFGHGTRGFASTRRAVRRIADALVALDPLPGLICLQEMETTSIRSTLADPQTKDGETQLSRFMEAFEAAFVAANKKGRYEAYYFPAHSYKSVGNNKPFYTTGLAVLAHEDFVIDHHNAEAPEDITHRHLHPIRGLKQTRICAHVRFRYKGLHPIDVFNTHLSLPSTMSKEFWTSPQRLGYGPNQLEEAKNLARFVDAERESDRFVVVGDFNSLPGSPAYRYLVEECRWADALAAVHGLDHDALVKWPTAGFMSMRMHLDHVFSGPGLAFHDFAGSHRFGERKAPFHGLSDHVPLIGQCRIVDPADPVR
ncbi:MAG: Endonuclease/exonuclease/phosphatase family [Myxococcaceae bacterium]|nr:Endonuclease/exonuclease/phosphatase family [Myxococcaceae bacterium]